MKIGVPTETKTREYRVGINPGGVASLVNDGHEVLVQAGGGLGSGVSDAEFERAGARIVPTAADAWSAELVMKVKEPLPSEFQFFRSDLTLFTYLHLAPMPELTDALMKTGVRAIAYETIEAKDGSLPLLRPMSEVAGRMATQVGATCLEKERGGKGVLLGGVPGTRRGRVVILGGGIVGSNAARIAVGMGAQVTVLDTSMQALRELDQHYGNRIQTRFSTRTVLDECLPKADLVIGAVLIPGAAAPKLVLRTHLESMKRGAVIVDVAIDQGGCVESARPTTHSNPTYVDSGVVHYCVANMPGAVARTATQALNNATLPFVLALAGKGVEQALRDDPYLRMGLNLCQGALTSAEVAASQGVEYVQRETPLGL